MKEAKMGCGDTPPKGGSGIGDLRRHKGPSTITLSRAEVGRMTELLAQGPKPFLREVDTRLLIMRLAGWAEERGMVRATDAARERFLLPDGSLNPNVTVRD
jgi:hypothetical protein